MGKRRTKLYIYFDILKLLIENREGMTPTQIMKKINTTNENINNYLEFLKTRNLLEIQLLERGCRIVRIKEKGERYCQEFEKIINMLT